MRKWECGIRKSVAGSGCGLRVAGCGIGKTEGRNQRTDDRGSRFQIWDCRFRIEAAKG